MKRFTLLLFLSAFMAQSILWANTNSTQDFSEEAVVEQADSISVDSLKVAEEVVMEPMSEAEVEEDALAGSTQELKKRPLKGVLDLWVLYYFV